VARQYARRAYCAECRYFFGSGSPSRPCPDCGSESRRGYGSRVASAGVRAETRGVARWKVRRRGNRPALEVVHGTEPHQLSGELRDVDRVVDHMNDRYRERITGPDGTVLRDVDEPLSKHHGRGSAKG
jgi:hypothetical protein